MSKLTSISFDKFIRELDPFNKDAISFDLTKIHFVTPAALTQLCALSYTLHREGKQITFLLDQRVGPYLVRAGFVRSVRPVGRIEPEEYAQESGNDSVQGLNLLLVEVQKIESLESLPRLLDQIVAVLHHELEYEKNEAYDIVTAISEACQNTLDHNKGICGFIAMQVYRSGKDMFLEIGISDSGTGLSATLGKNGKNPRLESSLDAIKYAIQAGTSEYDDPTRGTGLYHLLKIMQKNSGLVQIHSGDGKIRYRLDKRNEWNGSVPNMPGVHIALVLNAKKYFSKGLDKIL